MKLKTNKQTTTKSNELINPADRLTKPLLPAVENAVSLQLEQSTAQWYKAISMLTSIMT